MDQIIGQSGFLHLVLCFGHIIGDAMEADAIMRRIEDGKRRTRILIAWLANTARIDEIAR